MNNNIHLKHQIDITDQNDICYCTDTFWRKTSMCCWISQLHFRYHSRSFKAFYHLINILNDQVRYREMENIGNKLYNTMKLQFSSWLDSTFFIWTYSPESRHIRTVNFCGSLLMSTGTVMSLLTQKSANVTHNLYCNYQITQRYWLI